MDAADIPEGDLSVEECNDILTDMAKTLQRGDIGDLSHAVEDLRDESDPVDGESPELPDDYTLPFYEEDREVAFAVGLTVGAVLEAKERAIESDDE